MTDPITQLVVSRDAERSTSPNVESDVIECFCSYWRLRMNGFPAYGAQHHPTCPCSTKQTIL